MKPKRMNRSFLTAGGFIIVLLCIVLTVLSAQKSRSAGRMAELLDLGNKYLTEHNYEQAALSFREAIETDPKCEEAYHGLAQTCIGMEDYETACEVLKQGIEQTGAEALTAYLQETEETYARMQEEAASQAKEEAVRLMREQEAGKPEEADTAAEPEKEEETEEQAQEETETEAPEEDEDASQTQEETSQEETLDETGAAGETTDADNDAGERVVHENGDYEITEYDAGGNKVKWTYYEADGTINRWETYEYEYGADGSYARIEYQYAWGTLYYITRFDYDANGNYVKGSQYLPDGTLYYEYHP